VDQIAIQAPGGFGWATQPDPTGAALAEFFPASSPGQGDLYMSPEVKSNLPAPGAALPLGGSTGRLILLKNGDPLLIRIIYQQSGAAETTSVQVSGLGSATEAMPAVFAPADVDPSFRVTSDGQDGTRPPGETGWVHLVVTAPSGIAFDATTFSQVVFELSDEAGIYWDSTTSTLGHNHIDAALRPGTSGTADLYFPPVRAESPPIGSSSSTMILRVDLPDDGRVYVSPFVGAAWDPARLIAPWNSQASPPAPTTETQLRAVLLSESPEYDTIELPADQTIVITQPLAITHSVRIVGNNATLLFQQGQTAAWPADASGAIYVDAPSFTNIQVELDDFTIAFDQGAPLRWSNPPGTLPAYWDPENNPGGVAHAVIDTRDSNSSVNRDILTLRGMTIHGPPAFDGAAFMSLRAQLGRSGDTAHEYAGEQDLDLIRTNDLDSGVIINSTFQGGSIEVTGGPWTITGSTVLGSTADTYSPSAFSLHSPHDVVVAANQVSQSDPAGREFRLVNLAGSGSLNRIEGNTFGGGAGQIGDEVTYDGSTGQFGGINDSEVILAESSYGVLFEGRPGAISADGRLVVLTGLRAAAFPGATGPGMVVSILAGEDSAGEPAMERAGQWFRVAQQVSLSSDNSIELLMEDPLPPQPQGGYYVIEVTSGFVNNSFDNNTINLTGRSSTGIVVDGLAYGTRIIGNDFTGGTTYDNVYTGGAIRLGSAIASAPSGSGAFPLPAGWTALPNLGSIIQGNTIRDSLGGISLGVEHGVNYWESRVTSASETGRVFVTASVTGNTFEWDSDFLENWASEYAALGNNPAEDSAPPALTIGSGWSAEPAGPHGSPRFPWTVGGVLAANGSDQPVFVDPIENVVTVQGNLAQIVATDGSAALQSSRAGQVYAGTINGSAYATSLAREAYNNQPYYPFHLHNLDISGSIATPTPAPTPAPNPTPTPSPSPAPPPPKSAMVPSAPRDVTAVAAGPIAIILSWASSPGATQYAVERSIDGRNWARIAMGVASLSYADFGLNASTVYDYRVVAASSAGESPASAIATARTGSLPDVLTIQPRILTLVTRRSFAGPVATFTDANILATSGSFSAIIRWGHGTVTRGTVEGGGGDFTVIGRHTYFAAGRFVVKVTVTMSAPVKAAASTKSIADVSRPAKVAARRPSRAIHARQRLTRHPASHPGRSHPQ
jgi:hypothetical protein